MKKVINEMLKIETKENLLNGDIWLTINYPEYKEGLFIQVESKELDNGEYSSDIFSVFAYENMLDDKKELTTNYNTTIIKFDFNKLDLDIVLGEEQELFTNGNGYIIYKTDKQDCTIELIEIYKDRRGQGKGKELLNEFINLQKEKNINYFELEAVLTDEATIKDLETLSNFYKKNGFIESGRDIEGTEEDRIFFFLEFLNDDKKIKLWIENRLDKEIEKSYLDIYLAFKKSDEYKQSVVRKLVSIENALNFFIGTKKGLNATIEKNDFIELSSYIFKKIEGDLKSSNH